MTKNEFLAFLETNQLPEPILVEQPANGGLDVHTHDFVVNAFVSEGEIRISCNGVETLYEVGDVFHLEHKEPHSESYGPLGVKYLVSRKSI